MWLTKIIGFSCKKVSALSDKKVHVGINLFEQSKLSLHLLICDGCKNYVRQSAMIDQILKQQLHKATSENSNDNEHFKMRIISAINKMQ